MNTLRLYTRLLFVCTALLVVSQSSMAMSIFNTIFASNSSNNRYVCVVCNEDIRAKNLPVYQMPCSKHHFVHMKCSKSIEFTCPSCHHTFDEHTKKQAFNNKAAHELMKQIKDAREEYQQKDDKGKGKGKTKSLHKPIRQKQQKKEAEKHFCPVCKDSKPAHTFVNFINCNHELCIGCMKETLNAENKMCPLCPRQQVQRPAQSFQMQRPQYDYVDRILSPNEIQLIRNQMHNMRNDMIKTLPEPKRFDWCTGYCARYEEEDRIKSLRPECGHVLCSACLLQNRPNTCPMPGCSQSIPDNALRYKFDKETKKLVLWQPQQKHHDIFCAGHCRTQEFIDRKKFVDTATGGFFVVKKSCGHHACLPCGIKNPVCQMSKLHDLPCGHQVAGACSPIPACSKCFYQYAAFGVVGAAAFGYTAYKGIQTWMYAIFNNIEHSANQLVRILISSEEPNWNFDLYNIPFIISALSVQHNIEELVKSVKSHELQQQLDVAIKNFDAAFYAIWHAIEHEGYYAKGKSVFMQDKKALVQTMQQRADELKKVLAECRAQASVWKKVLGIAALSALGVGAWIYTLS
ncbi:MAG TPA: hypothetical protein PLU71_01420 [Candidatus Dependentiae bacterium]|nr:hypothetical protein [Candidatus Dependentiae bacterium]HRQ62491.1 hypothetical protein [Candidatus Dependentiae bacterium]